jgi:hypothetical protein
MSDIAVIERELRQQYPSPSAAATARARAAVTKTTLEGSRPVRAAHARRRWRPVLVAAVAVLALAATGVAIANGLGAFNGGVFNGLSSAHHPRTSDDVIDPATRAYIERKNCKQPDGRPCAPMIVGMRFGTSRRIAQLPDGQSLYVLKTTWDGLCFVAGPPPHGRFNCSRPLSRAHPSTVWFDSSGPDVSSWFTFGVALDGVTSVSFEPNGQKLTLPVKGNVWTYHGDSFEATTALIGLPLTAHFADGKTVTDNCTDSLSRHELRLLGAPKSQIPRLAGPCGR